MRKENIKLSSKIEERIFKFSTEVANNNDLEYVVEDMYSKKMIFFYYYY